jgi:hypothetical protein
MAFHRLQMVVCHLKMAFPLLKKVSAPLNVAAASVRRRLPV